MAIDNSYFFRNFANRYDKGTCQPKAEEAMKKGSLMFIPSGGLANRMRAIASAYALTQETESDLQVVWFRDWALNAPFRSVFVLPAQLSLREATPLDHLLYDRARRRNLWLPALPQRLLFERHIKEQMVTPLKKQDFDFKDWARGHRCYMSCYQVFGDFSDSLYSILFHPVKVVIDNVNRFREQFSSHCIGLHIRRTDNIESINQSPTNLFIDKVKEEIDTHADTTVFLATDSDEVKNELRKIFGTRIITPNKEACRNNIEGIRGGLIDMWTLSTTQKIYGSVGSSFSAMAASIGGTKFEMVKK